MLYEVLYEVLYLEVQGPAQKTEEADFEYENEVDPRGFEPLTF